MQAEALGQMLEVVPALVRLLTRAVGSAGGADRLTLTGYRLLRKLSDGCELTTELAGRLEITVATVSAAIDGLVRRGLVERLPPAPGDRRAVPLAVTGAGRAVLAAGRRRQEAALRELLSALDPAELQGLTLGLGALRRALAGPPGG